MSVVFLLNTPPPPPLFIPFVLSRLFVLLATSVGVFVTDGPIMAHNDGGLQQDHHHDGDVDADALYDDLPDLAAAAAAEATSTTRRLGTLNKTTLDTPLLFFNACVCKRVCIFNVRLDVYTRHRHIHT